MLDSRRPIYVDRKEQRCVIILGQPIPQFCSAGRLTGSLQPDHQENVAQPDGLADPQAYVRAWTKLALDQLSARR